MADHSDKKSVIALERQQNVRTERLQDRLLQPLISH